MAEHEESRHRPVRRDEDIDQGPDKSSEDRPRRSTHGRTLGDSATSYSSVRGTQERKKRGAKAGGAEQGISYRPGLGDGVEEMEEIVEEIEEDEGYQLPYTGEMASTRGSTFEENPNTGETAEEEEGEFLRESLEKRTRGYESG